MKILVFTIHIILLACTIAFAQPNLPPPDPERVPISGIEILLIGGGAYGVYRASKKKKNSQA